MQKNLKVLIGDSTRSLGVFCQNLLQKSGVETVLTPKDGTEVLKAIQEENPDVAVLEAFMFRLDAVGVMQALQQTACRPKVIVIGGCDDPNLEAKLIQAGASCYIPKPFDYQVLCEQIRVLGGLDPADCARRRTEADLESIVTDMMLYIGIPANVRGYRYIREAILLTVNDSSLVNAMAKRLYSAIAEKFDTSPSGVERAIRYAVGLAWERGDVDVLNSYFGDTANTSRRKPAGGEFIAVIANQIHLRMNVRQKEWIAF